MTDEMNGCVTTAGPVVAEEDLADQPMIKKEVSMTQAKVGKPAPDFALNAFHQEGLRTSNDRMTKASGLLFASTPGILLLFDQPN